MSKDRDFNALKSRVRNIMGVYLMKYEPGNIPYMELDIDKNIEEVLKCSYLTEDNVEILIEKV